MCHQRINVLFYGIKSLHFVHWNILRLLQRFLHHNFLWILKETLFSFKHLILLFLLIANDFSQEMIR